MEFKKLYLLVISGLILLLAACNDNSEETAPAEEPEAETEETNNEATESEEEQEEEASSPENIAYKNFFKIKSSKDEDDDDFTQIDNDVELPKSSDQVVVFDLSAASTFAALDLEGNITGIQKGEDGEHLNEELSDIYGSNDHVNVGSEDEIDYGAVEELDPEVIVIGEDESYSAVIRQLEEAAPNAEIISVDKDSTTYVENIIEFTSFLGEMYGVEDHAENLVDDLNTNLTELKERVLDLEENLLYFEVNDEDLNIDETSGINDFLFSEVGFNRVLEQASNENSEVDPNADFGFSTISSLNPGIILALNTNEEKDIQTVTEEILTNESLTNINAVINENVYVISEENWDEDSAGYLAIMNQIEDLSGMLDSIEENNNEE